MLPRIDELALNDPVSLISLQKMPIHYFCRRDGMQISLTSESEIRGTFVIIRLARNYYLISTSFLTPLHDTLLAT